MFTPSLYHNIGNIVLIMVLDNKLDDILTEFYFVFGEAEG